MSRNGIYLIGLVFLGLAHEWLRMTLNGPISLAIAVVYLLIVRFIAERFGNKNL